MTTLRVFNECCDFCSRLTRKGLWNSNVVPVLDISVYFHAPISGHINHLTPVLDHPTKYVQCDPQLTSNVVRRMQHSLDDVRISIVNQQTNIFLNSQQEPFHSLTKATESNLR